jgi:hypothetical protein
MIDCKTGVSRRNKYLFLERHYIGGIAFLISKRRIEVNVLGRSYRVYNMAAPEIII